MAGPATEAETIVQWKAAVDILETARVHFDDVQAGAGGKLEILENALTGEFTPAPMALAAANFRAGMSGMMDPATIRAFLDPIIFEYGKVIDSDAGGDTFGGGYATPDQILLAMYEFFVKKATTVESRGIAYGVPAITTAVGDGVLSRLTVDENGYEMEACTVEKKHFRCRSDQNSGTEKYAEVFEYLGQQLSQDSLLKGSTGSGGTGQITSRHAGGSDGGSLLDNGSFSSFSATQSPKFSSWDEVFAGGATAAGIAQETTAANLYRSHPGETTPGALELTVNNAAHTITFKQTLENLNAGDLRRDRPYFLRVMIRKDVGTTAVGGTIALRLGSQTVTRTIAAMGAGYEELFIPLDANSWFVNFNQDETAGGMVEFEWSGGTAGTVLFDDMIFAEMDFIDGSYWNLRLNDAAPTAWLVDDEITVTDTYDVAFGNGKLNYYMFAGYGRYLPHQGTPSISDP